MTAPRVPSLSVFFPALMLALRGLDIGPGDEVITAPLTAAYTALAIRMAGATPVFADIDPGRCTLAPRAVEARSPHARAPSCPCICMDRRPT